MFQVSYFLIYTLSAYFFGDICNITLYITHLLFIIILKTDNSNNIINLQYGKQEGRGVKFKGCNATSSNCNKKSKNNLRDGAVYGTQSSAIGDIWIGDTDDTITNHLGNKLKNLIITSYVVKFKLKLIIV